MEAARADVLGCRIDRLTLDETVRRCEEIVAEGGFAQHVCINAAKVVALREDDRLREIVERCELVGLDGKPLVWVSRLLGDPLPGRVNGTDLMFRLFALAEQKGYRIFVLGAREEVLGRAVERLRGRYPRLEIAGYQHGYFDDGESEEVCARIRESRADILFVAMSSPRKEYWLGEHGRRTGVHLAVGVGGSIDIVAGLTRRAPMWMQRSGLEWLFRLLQEPRRLWRRYLFTNVRFLALVVRALVTRRPAPRRV